MSCQKVKKNKETDIMAICLNAYDGELLDGRPHGEGTYICFNGDKYVGNWKEGKRHGVGQLIFSDGRYYQGNWKEDMKDGSGKFVSINNEVYQGEWKNDERNGEGTIDYENGDCYTGNFENGLPNGNGLKVFNNKKEKGNVYKGEFKDGLMHGKGKMMFSNNGVYEGDWQNNYMEGYGQLRYPSYGCVGCMSGKYEGNFIRPEYSANDTCDHSFGNFSEKDSKTIKRNNRILTYYGVRHGYGKCNFFYGVEYEGEWSKNKENGDGIFTCDGTKCPGRWIRKELYLTVEGDCECIHDDGSIYSGHVKIDLMSVFHPLKYTKGKLIRENGEVYEGEWDKKKLTTGIKQIYGIYHHYELGKCVGYSFDNNKIYRILCCALIASKIDRYVLNRKKYEKIDQD